MRIIWVLTFMVIGSIILTGCAYSAATAPTTIRPTSTISLTNEPDIEATLPSLLPPPSPSSSLYPSHTAINHDYYRELTEFTVRVTDDPNSTKPFTATYEPVSFQSKYIQQSSVNDLREAKDHQQKTAYLFEKVDTHEKVYLLFPPGLADAIDLTPGEIYRIDYQILYGWPNAYGLIIKQEDSFIFAGISDWLNTVLNINSLLPIKVQLSRVLTDNYIEGESYESFLRKTNTEISFLLNGDSISLHQGQSSILNGFEIKLLVARDIQYNPNWVDAGQVGLSYVISRTK
jgi:hypothetical protein